MKCLPSKWHNNVKWFVYNIVYKFKCIFEKVNKQVQQHVYKSLIIRLKILNNDKYKK